MTQTTWLLSAAEIRERRDQWAAGYILDADGHLFNQPHGAGYWLYGVAHDPARGWLAFEHGEEVDVDKLDTEEAERRWAAGDRLPARYFRLDRELADRAYDLAARKWGEAWTDELDLPRADEVVQFALLGEIRYG